MNQPYQPWTKEWRKDITFVPYLEPVNDLTRALPPLDGYPLFWAVADQELEGEVLWQASAGALLYFVGHEPGHLQVPRYVDWIRQYNPEAAVQMTLEGTLAANRKDFTTAVWMLQAAILVDPLLESAHYNLGLVFSQLGDKLYKERQEEPAQSCFRQSEQYLKNAIQLNDQNKDAYYVLGIICGRLNQAKEGLGYVEKAMAMEKEMTARKEKRLQEFKEKKFEKKVEQDNRRRQ